MQLDYKYDDYCTQNASQIWNLFPSNISWALLEKKGLVNWKIGCNKFKSVSKNQETKQIWRKKRNFRDWSAVFERKSCS